MFCFSTCLNTASYWSVHFIVACSENLHQYCHLVVWLCHNTPVNRWRCVPTMSFIVPRVFFSPYVFIPVLKTFLNCFEIESLIILLFFLPSCTWYLVVFLMFHLKQKTFFLFLDGLFFYPFTFYPSSCSPYSSVLYQLLHYVARSSRLCS